MTSYVSYAVNTAQNCVGYALDTATLATGKAYSTANGIVGYVNEKVINTVEFGKVVITGASTTIISHTPNQILQLIQTTSESCKATVQDPVGVAKNYIPAFVIHFGEKTYEIAHETKDKAVSNTIATKGLIIHKVNGVVEKIVSVPQVHTLLERIESLTIPVLNKFGITKNPLGYILHDNKTGEKVLIVDANSEENKLPIDKKETKKTETKKSQ